jgi:hypothetical protein
MPDDEDTRREKFTDIGDRLIDVGKRLRQAPSVTREQPPSVLEEALAEKIWLALGRRSDRVERVIVALRRRSAGESGESGA